jgi:hypothetical protein
MHPLVLSIGSFIGAFALSAGVSRGHILPLIVLFGLCDARNSAACCQRRES